MSSPRAFSSSRHPQIDSPRLTVGQRERCRASAKARERFGIAFFTGLEIVNGLNQKLARRQPEYREATLLIGTTDGDKAAERGPLILVLRKQHGHVIADRLSAIVGNSAVHLGAPLRDRKSTRLNSSHLVI